MPRNIQLSDEVYAKLEEFRGKRETFSEAVERLLNLLSKVSELREILEGQLAFRKHKLERLEQEEAAQR